LSRPVAARVAWSLWALVIALDAATAVLAVMAGEVEGGGIATFVVAFIVFQIFATVGAVVASRRPENPIGWFFLVAAILLMTANLDGAYVDLALARSLPGAVPVAVALGWTWPVGLGLLLVLIIRFPDGRLPSSHWRPIERLAVGLLAAVVLLSVFGPLEEPLEDADNPVGIGIGGFSVVVAPVLFAGVLVVTIAAVAALVYRLRRAPEQRQQIKLFLAAVGLALVFDLSLAIADAVSSSFDGGPAALWLAVLGTIPVSVGVAILRYQLYDIDRIINRTLVYGVLTAGLAGLYFGIVLALQQIFSSFTQDNKLAIAGSTLAVAALFRPARRRIQALVDRRFYRRKYDTQQTLEAFSARLREEIDLDTLTAELRAVVRETIQPAHVSLWIRPKFEASTRPGSVAAPTRFHVATVREQARAGGLGTSGEPT
jgi:hypothetical protein